MNNDAKLIFERYLAKKQDVLLEYPIDMTGDIDVEPVTKKTLPGQGKKYGAGAITAISQKTGASEEDVARDMARTILDNIKERKQIGEKEVHYYPGDPKTFIAEMTPVFASKYGIPQSQAGYTINYILIYLLKANKVTGGLKKTGAQRKADRVQKVKDVKSAAVTVYEVNKAVKVKDPVLAAVKQGLPDEDIDEKEVLSVIKQTISDYNESPGLDKAQIIKAKPMAVFDALEKAGILAAKQVTPAAEPEAGVGTGEVATPDEEVLQGLGNDREFINSYVAFQEVPGGADYITDYGH